MSDNLVLWQYKCLICCKEKPIRPLLIIEDMPICESCGEWSADGCAGYPQHPILINEFQTRLQSRTTHEKPIQE